MTTPLNARVAARVVLDGDLTEEQAVDKFAADPGPLYHYGNRQQQRDAWVVEFHLHLERQRRFRETVEGHRGDDVRPVDWRTAQQRAGDAWLCEPLLASGKAQYLCAPEGSGKSLLALELAVRLADGQPFLAKGPTEPARVLYLDYERSQDVLLRRLDSMGVVWKRGDIENLRYLDSRALVRAPRLHTRDGGEWALAEAVAWGADVVIIDSYVRAVGGENTNSDATPTAFYNETVTRLTAEDASVLWLSHTGWNNTRRTAGSRQQTAVADYGIVMEQPRQDHLVLRVTKDNENEAAAAVYAIDRKDEPVLHHELGDGLTVRQREVVVRMREAGRRDWTVRTVRAASRCNQETAEAALAYLRDTGEVD